MSGEQGRARLNDESIEFSERSFEFFLGKQIGNVLCRGCKRSSNSPLNPRNSILSLIDRIRLIFDQEAPPFYFLPNFLIEHTNRIVKRSQWESHHVVVQTTCIIGDIVWVQSHQSIYISLSIVHAVMQLYRNGRRSIMFFREDVIRL